MDRAPRLEELRVRFHEARFDPRQTEANVRALDPWVAPLLGVETARVKVRVYAGGGTASDPTFVPRAGLSVRQPWYHLLDALPPDAGPLPPVSLVAVPPVATVVTVPAEGLAPDALPPDGAALCLSAHQHLLQGSAPRTHRLRHRNGTRPSLTQRVLVRCVDLQLEAAAQLAAPITPGMRALVLLGCTRPTVVPPPAAATVVPDHLRVLQRFIEAVSDDLVLWPTMSSGVTLLGLLRCLEAAGPLPRRLAVRLDGDTKAGDGLRGRLLKLVEEHPKLEVHLYVPPSVQWTGSVQPPGSFADDALSVQGRVTVHTHGPLHCRGFVAHLLHRLVGWGERPIPPPVAKWRPTGAPHDGHGPPRPGVAPAPGLLPEPVGRAGDRAVARPGARRGLAGAPPPSRPLGAGGGPRDDEFRPGGRGGGPAARGRSLGGPAACAAPGPHRRGRSPRTAAAGVTTAAQALGARAQRARAAAAAGGGWAAHAGPGGHPSHGNRPPRVTGHDHGRGGGRPRAAAASGSDTRPLWQAPARPARGTSSGDRRVPGGWGASPGPPYPRRAMRS